MQIKFSPPDITCAEISEVIKALRSGWITTGPKTKEFENKGYIISLYDDVIDQIDGVIHMTPQDAYPRMVLALNEGEVDAITAEMPVAQGVVAANEGLAIVTFEEGHGFVADTTVSIALAKNSELKDQINDILSNISQDERNQIMLDATDRQPATN